MYKCIHICVCMYIYMYIYIYIYISMSLPQDCKEICCRAVDSNQNMQPMYLTWNVMGMMNNCLFRIKVRPPSCQCLFVNVLKTI